MVKLFSTVLRRDDIGDHWLITPVEMCRIEVEDTAYLGVELMVEGAGTSSQRLTIRTNIDEIFEIGPNHPLIVDVDPKTQEPKPIVTLNWGLEARLTRAVFYQLVDLAVEETQARAHLFGVWSAGQFFALGDPTET